MRRQLFLLTVIRIYYAINQLFERMDGVMLQSCLQVINNNIDDKNIYLNLPNESQFLYLTTRGGKTGKQHTIEIWFVGYLQKVLCNVRT